MVGTEGVISISREKFDNTVSEILNRPEYSHLNNNYMSYVERLKDYIKEIIKKLFDIIGRSAEGVQVSDKTAYIVLVVCLIIIIAVIALIVLRISKAIDKNKNVKELFGTVIDKNVTPFEMMKKSAEYKGIRDYRNAVKFSFIAILLMLHNKDIIFLDEAKTNGEILGILKSRDFSHTRTFEMLVGLFNDTWYGHKIMSEDDYALWEQNSSALWEGVSREAKE